MKALYRTRQFILSLGVKLINHKSAKKISGIDSIDKSIDIFKENNIDNVLIVTTKGFIKRKSLDNYFNKLTENNIKYSLFLDVVNDPTVKCIEEGKEAYQNANSKAIIAIGGGSVMDAAKIIGARATNPKKTVPQLRGMLKVSKKIPLLICAPTTCGTGSEATAAAVITDFIDNKNYKYAVTDLKIVPEYAILDYSLIKTLPPKLVGYTMMDALSHATEAYVNKYGSKKVTNAAFKAIKLIFDNYEKALNQDPEALGNMLEASYQAGIAITNNYVGYVHAIAHGIGAIYHLEHGYVIGATLPYVLEAYDTSIYKKIGKLARYLGLEGNNDKELTINYINKIKELNKLINIPTNLDIEDYMIEELATRANKEANPMYPVPKILNKQGIKEIIIKMKKAD